MLQHLTSSAIQPRAWAVGRIHLGNVLAVCHVAKVHAYFLYLQLRSTMYVECVVHACARVHVSERTFYTHLSVTALKFLRMASNNMINSCQNAFKHGRDMQVVVWSIVCSIINSVRRL